MPETVQWSDSYLIGNAKLDQQHQKLFEIAKELEELESSPDQNSKITGILNELRDYMLYHFQEEELFMQEVRYPGFKEHKVLHQRFINDMRSIIKVPVRLNVLKIRIHTFIQEWLVHHIVQEDMKIQSWVKKSRPDEVILDLDLP